MIQDIAPYKFHNEFIEADPKDDDVVFFFMDPRKVLVGKAPKGSESIEHPDGNGDAVRFPTRAEVLQANVIKEKHLVFLFYVEEPDGKVRQFYRAENEHFSEEKLAERLPDFHFETVRSIHKSVRKDLSLAVTTGLHLHHWYSTTKYCGKCGHELEASKEERAMVCSKCKNIIYPRLDPAVIVAVVDGDRIIVSKYRDREYKGIALLAGFCEIGESIEQTVRREVMEETKLPVQKMKYYKSQPWGMARNLLSGMYVQADSSLPLEVDLEELAYAQWIDRDSIPVDENPLSLTGEMIQMFRKYGSPFVSDWLENTEL